MTKFIFWKEYIMNSKPTTGTNYYKEQTMFAVSFDKNMCPICGHTLRLIKMFTNSSNVAIRYQCDNCEFICPIQHYGETLDKIKPLYNNNIHNFVQDFGSV